MFPPLLGFALTVSSMTLAQTGVDADLVQRATVGPSSAIAPTSATTVSRARRAPFAFPTSMRVVWRARITGPVTLEPVVDDAGRIVLLHERGSLSMLSDTGTTSWSLRLGDATPAVAPALLSDGTLAVYNFDDRLLRIDGAGNLVGSTRLGLKGKPGSLLPLERGGVALAVDDHLVQVDHRGEVIARAEAEHVIAELLQARPGVIAVDKQGQIYRFHATGQLSPQGTFGSAVVSVALAGDTLFAITTGQHLVSLALGTQTVRTIYSAAPSKTLQPWLALGPKTIHVAASDGTLRGLSHGGRERMQLVLGDGDPSRPGAALLPSATSALADAGSRVMLASPGAETILVEADGSHHRIASSACLAPMSLTPMPRQRVLLVCRNGEMLAFAAARSQASDASAAPAAPASTPSLPPAAPQP